MTVLVFGDVEAIHVVVEVLIWAAGGLKYRNPCFDRTKLWVVGSIVGALFVACSILLVFELNCNVFGSVGPIGSERGYHCELTIGECDVPELEEICMSSCFDS